MPSLQSQNAYTLAMNKRYPQRKSPRLRRYDYAQEGTYFVTICTYQRACWFGNIVDGEMQRSSMGHIAAACWETIPDHYFGVELDCFVVMPNHVHGVIMLIGNSVALGTIIGTYKAAVTRQIHSTYNRRPKRLWQDRYHDHIIRSEKMLNHIREYEQNNPLRWHEDTFYAVT